jgi:tetratricopeptide (TPR) repeat protein
VRFAPKAPDKDNALAGLCRIQKKYQGAESLYTRALAVLETALGSDNPLVAQSLNDFGLLYLALGNYSEAESRLRRSLEVREKVLGREHPDVAQSLNNVPLLTKAQGKYAEAESLYERSLAINEKSSGP